MSRQLSGLILLVGLVCGAILYSSAEKPRYAFGEVCRFVSDRYYKNDDTLKNWTDFCLDIAERLPLFASREDVVTGLRGVMSYLPISHLDVYTPEEEKRVWQGIGKDTGVRVRLVEDYFVVSHVLDAASRADIKVGDVVYKLNGEYLERADTVETTPGVYTVLRLKPGVRPRDQFSVEMFDELEIAVKTREISVDFTNRVYDYKGWRVLRIGSFKAATFGDDEWEKLLNEFIDAKKLVVDLRGNLGGDFAALLRAVSPFFCQPEVIGHMLAPRRNVVEPMDFPDTVDADGQFEVLEKAKKVNLKTFSKYGCFKGDVKVLVDELTASSAEIFAQAILEAERGEVLGQKTKGEVVLSVWYDISYILGEGFSISIPEAVYRSSGGQAIEQTGVKPQREIYYQLKHELYGRDSWLEGL